MIGITFGSSEYFESMDVLLGSAIAQNDYKKFIRYRPSDLNTEFIRLNKDIFNQQRGYGYWLFKPYLLYKTMSEYEENEVIVYFDAGVRVLNNLNHIADRMDQDIFLFGNMWTAKHWTKGDIYKAIGVEPDDSKQVQASVIFVRNTPFARDFIKEWLLYCQMPGLIDDSPSKMPNDPEFRENRHDQAILHVLSQKHGIKKHWWPASYNNGAFVYEKGIYTDNYPVLFDHHRRKNEDWK